MLKDALQTSIHQADSGSGFMVVNGKRILYSDAKKFDFDDAQWQSLLETSRPYQVTKVNASEFVAN